MTGRFCDLKIPKDRHVISSEVEKSPFEAVFF